MPPGDPYIWLDSTDIDGAGNSTLTDGGATGAWRNKGALGGTWPTGSTSPTYAASAAGGNPAARCAGGIVGEGYSRITGWSLATPAYTALAARMRSTTSGYGIFISGNYIFWQATGAGAPNIQAALAGASSVASITDVHCGVLLRDGTSLDFRVDNGAALIGAQSIAAESYLTIGTQSLGFASSPIDIFQVLMIPAGSGVSHQSIYDFFAAKLGQSLPFAP